MRPRTPAQRVAYMKAHPPGRVGLCARTVWRSLNVPPIGAPSASVAVRIVKRAGKLHTGDDNIPYGAVVLWTGGRHGYGHAALYVGDDRILTTDPPGHPGRVGITRLNMPRLRWGLHYAGWTQWWGKDLPR